MSKLQATGNEDSSTLGDIGEFALIERIRTWCGPAPRDVLVGIGDDAAVLVRPGGDLVLTVDACVESIHFLAEWDPVSVGRWVLTRALSDLAAMGASPLACLVSAAFPLSTPVRRIEALYAGLTERAATTGAPIVGGNLTRAAEGGIALHVTCAGTLAGAPLCRSGARPGDAIFVTGPLGGPARALRTTRGATPAHLDREPRLAAGCILAASGAVTAAIDVSDGLGQDLGHILQESQVGAVLDLDALPLDGPGVTVEDALTSGDEVELVFLGNRERLASAIDRVQKECRAPVTRIGEARAKSGLFGTRSRGPEEPISLTGYDHFRRAP